MEEKKVTSKNERWQTKPIKLHIELQGEELGHHWSCHAEFVFSNTESFSCKVISGLKEITELYNTGKGIRFGFLQAMSGISTTEDKLTKGSIKRKLGEGKTAEVLRNICYEILFPDTPYPAHYKAEEKWLQLCRHIKTMFGATLRPPEFIRATGLIQLEYEENKIRYDISLGGRGFQQTLLLLAFMYAQPNTILLFDEPDAHLEVIRQREVFHLINQTAHDLGTQVLIASHSEVVLNEAAETSTVIALIENNVLELNKSSSPQKNRAIKMALTKIGYAEQLSIKHPSFSAAQLMETMRQTVQDSTVPRYLKDLKDEWWQKAKLSDEWLDVVFPEFFKRMGLPQNFYKRDYFQLILFLKPEEIDNEMSEKLDTLFEFLS